MKLPVVNVTVSMNELPNYIAVAVEFGNCKQKCHGCHSEWLSIPLPKKSWMELEDLMCLINKQVKQGADAIVLMGGTNNGVEPKELIEAINILSHYAPVGLYSGLPVHAAIHERLKDDDVKLSFLKVGDYKAKLGGLTSPGTNQRFYQKNGEGVWEDITFLFWKD